MPLIDTTTHWSVDDVSLQSFAHNVDELDSKFGTPGLRGGDLTPGYRAGDKWMPKAPDSATVSLGMWISGRGPAGEVTALGKELQFQKNMRDLQNLLYTGGRRQVKLTKRWTDPITGTVVSADAMAEVRKPLRPKLEPGAISARMVVEFHLADPYFYGAEERVDLVRDTAKIINIKGDDPTIRIKITFNGELTDPRLTNNTVSHWVEARMTVADGASLYLNTEEFRASYGVLGENVVNNIRRSGGREWLELYPGDNELLFTSLATATTTGTASVFWRPVYF